MKVLTGSILGSSLLVAAMGLFCVGLVGCAGDSREWNEDYTPWSPGEFRSLISHAPDLKGWRQLKSTAVQFREYTIEHPDGEWRVRLDMPSDKRPIRISTASGENHDLAVEWYPEEGGADAAAVLGFVKDDETLVIIQGTSDITYMETRARFRGGKMVDLRRYAAKGGGMGPGMPGKEPAYKVYPPS